MACVVITRLGDADGGHDMRGIGAGTASSGEQTARLEAIEQRDEQDLFCLAGQKAFAKLGEPGIMATRIGQLSP